MKARLSIAFYESDGIQIASPILNESLKNGKSYFLNIVGIGGLVVTCSPRDPRFAGSNPTEVDGFFRT